MAGQNSTPDRSKRDMTSLRVDDSSAARREAMPRDERPKLTGIIGDLSAEAGESRSGEDTRRRGWYWNWNTMVTQFAPLIGLDGKGLLDSYIVWTDRREDSPFRGYAFPSTTAEANFYGIDRNVLGTINKILVTLDLIEIRKSMVHRPDETGNDWKFPHNTYRVKDHGDNFQLTADAVRKVVQLAIDDQAVYRRIKHIFGSKFRPIDPQSVWFDIIAELEPTANWQKLKQVAEADERRTSERSRKGHAARRKSESTEKPVSITKPAASSTRTVPAPSTVSTVAPVSNDSTIDTTVASETSAKTTAASTSNGSETSAAQSSNASGVLASSDAAPFSQGSVTVAPTTSTTYYEPITTTTTGDSDAQSRTATPNVHQPGLLEDFGGGPDDSRDRELTLRLFDDANDKTATIAARRLLARMATEFADVAQAVSLTGWSLVGVAIEEAVSSGSAFVAPKRVREILQRWRKDGVPAQYAAVSVRHDEPAQKHTAPVTAKDSGSHRIVRTPEQPGSTTTPSGASVAADYGDTWERTIRMVAEDGQIPEGVLAQLRTDARIASIEGGTASVEVSDRLLPILTETIQRTLQRKLSVVVRSPLYIRLQASSSVPDTVSRQFVEVGAGGAASGQFQVTDTGLTNTQLWLAVQQSLAGGGSIPRAELAQWANESELLDLVGDTFILGFANGFLCRRASHRLRDLEREFSYLAGFTCRVQIVERDLWRSQQMEKRA